MSESTDLTKRTEQMMEEHKELITVAPFVDIYENEDEILMHADMAGVTKERVTVHVDNGKLEIAGVRKLEMKGVENWQEFGNVEFRRVFSVPQTIDVANVNAELKDGVLKLHLPKAEAAKPKTIEIRTA
jgi:HSP20 family protein